MVPRSRIECLPRTAEAGYRTCRAELSDIATRRHPMSHTLLVGLILLLCICAAQSQERAPRIPNAGAILKTLRPEHPRLLCDAARFDLLKQRVRDDSIVAGWYRKVKASGESI